MRPPLPPTAAAFLPLLLLPQISALPTEDCPILGPLYPPSTYDIASSQAFKNAKKAFPSTIQKLFDTGIIDPKTSTFALDLFSTRTNESLYNYSHAATSPAWDDSLSAGVLDDQTVFRTGSVSKLHTVYAILVAGGKGLDVFDEKVVKYVPELAPQRENDGGEEGEDERGDLERIKWDEVTIGALASQQGGTGGPTTTVAACGCNEQGTGCDPSLAPDCVQDFLTYLRTLKRPAHPIFQTPTYSDAGYLVLTQVLVSMTNMTYDAAIKKYLAEPLGMNTTATVAGEAQEANAVFRPGGYANGSNWGVDNQALAGSGGIYSNLRDLRLLGLSILNNELLDPLTTKHWMKPSGLITSPYKAIGAPWEIERLEIPVSPNSNRTRISDQYTKAGGQFGYTAVLLLSPDHGIGYSVLVAGPGAGGDRWPLRAALGETFVPAVEWAGYEHANETWQGTYVDEADEGTNITLAIYPDHPGVNVAAMFVGGIEWRANLTTISAPALPEEVLANLSTPMYPTGLVESMRNGCERHGFRAVPTILPHTFPMDRPAAQGGSGLFDDACMSPFATAAFYALESGAYIDDFVLVFDGKGRIESIEYPATGAKLTKSL